MWGFTGILGKLIHLDPIPIVWYRVFIAAIGILIALPFLKLSVRLANPKDIYKLIVVGVFVSLHWVTFYKSIALSTASFGILCLSTTTLHVTWLEPIIMKRKFSLSEFLLGIIVILGILFVTYESTSTNTEALIYGLLSALFAALFAVFNAKLVETIPSPQISFYEMLVGIVFLTILLLINGDLNSTKLSITFWDGFWLIFLGLACTSFAFIAVINVVKHLGAFTVTLSINLEPVYTIVLAIFILQENEVLGTKFYLGSFIIILVVLINAFLKSRQRKKQRVLVMDKA